MNKRLHKIIDSMMEQQIEDLQALLRIPSVSRGEPQPGMPLGEAMDAALGQALALAWRLGFTRIQNLDGLCGTIDFGEVEEMLGVLAHLDVVPAGEGWDHPPFGAEIHHGRIYARGVVDNKGPAVSALYALAAVREAGVPLTRRVRIILGCDEEIGWSCIDRYKQTEPDPDLAFSPDAEYPVVNCERGILQVRYEKNYRSGLRIHCGTAANVIPGSASATLPLPALPCPLPTGLSGRFAAHMVEVTGRGGHASKPELAANALQGLLQALAMQELPGEDQAAIRALAVLFSMDQHGESMGIDTTDDSGRLSLAPTVLRADQSGIALEMDCRYPHSQTTESLLATWDGLFAAAGFVRTQTRNTPGHLVPLGSELVTGLLKVYTQYMGKEARPLAIGGGTYARAFRGAVGFGPVPAGEASQCHMPNESMSLGEIRTNTILLAEAICELAGTKKD